MNILLDGKQISAPVISKELQPWKNKDISNEDLVMDLMGCIIQFWSHYRTKDYTQEEAISDAYEGILKAIEKDKLAPNFGKNQKIKCKCCSEKFSPPTSSIGDERANKLYESCPYGRTPTYRKILVKCPACGHEQLEKVAKSAFSSLAYCYIRSSIQRNVGKMHHKVKNNKIEVSLDSEENDIIGGLTSNPTNHEEKLPDAVTKVLYKTIEGLVERQRLVLSFHHGLGDIYSKKTEKNLECQHCNESFTAVVDYNVAENNIKCPHCEENNTIDMRVPKSVKCHHCAESFTTYIDYGKSKNYDLCPHCGTENTIDMCMNQTDIAKILSVSKQRVCSMVKTATNHMQENLGDIIAKYGII